MQRLAEVVEPMSNDAMRKQSGYVSTANPVAVLLYLLARDHLPVGNGSGSGSGDGNGYGEEDDTIDP